MLLYNNSFQIQLSRVQSLQKLSSQFYFNVTLEHHSFSSLEVFFSSQIHIHITIYVKVKNLQKIFNKQQVLEYRDIVYTHLKWKKAPKVITRPRLAAESSGEGTHW